jgi:hypothetical protein
MSWVGPTAVAVDMVMKGRTPLSLLRTEAKPPSTYQYVQTAITGLEITQAKHKSGMVLQPHMGLLHQPLKIDGVSTECVIGRGKPSLESNLLQRHFVHHKSNVDYSTTEPGSPPRENGN